MDTTASTPQPAPPGPDGDVDAARPPAPAPATPPAAPALTRSPVLGGWWRLAAFVVIAAAAVARFVAPSELWLDEALSVNIARLPLADIPAALRNDGAPPLYYVLLHGWIGLFGAGTVAVRALSGLFAVSALPLAFLAGRVAGRRVSGVPAGGDGPDRAAWTALLVVALSPYAIRYGSEARMYSLLVVFVLVGYLALDRIREGGGIGWAGLLAVVTGLGLLTHYWFGYLLVVVAVGLVVAWRRGPAAGRPACGRSLVALAAGSLLFLPWLPSFVHQVTNTGAPWGRPGTLRAVFDTVIEFGGGYRDPGYVFGLILLGLVLVSVLGRPVAGGGVVWDGHVRGPGRDLAAVAVGTLALGLVIGRLGDSAYAVRYAAVVFPLVVLAAAAGAAILPNRRVWLALMASVMGLGLWADLSLRSDVRTTAPAVARAVAASARAGDVVVYCPDQLGPAVSRLLPAGIEVEQLTYPRATGPEFVDWTDYEETNARSSPLAFARMLLSRVAPGHGIWVVTAPGYRTFGSTCEDMVGHLEDALGPAQTVVPPPRRGFERPGLVLVSGPGARVGFGP